MTNAPEEKPSSSDDQKTPSTYDEVPPPVSATGKDRDFAYVKDTDSPPSAHEESLLHKLSEVGNDTVKRLKDILSEIDRDEVKRSINRDKIQRSVATAFDSLNTKVQDMLATKGENRKKEEEKADAASASPHTDPFSAQPTADSTSETAPAPGPGPVGTEAVQPESKEDPFLRNPEDRPEGNRGF